MQIKNLVELHMDAERYYRRCAKITTELDLKELFEELSMQRQTMGKNILDATRQNSMVVNRHFLALPSYFHQIWSSMKVALIVNNRRNLLSHCVKNETDILKAIDSAYAVPGMPEETCHLLTIHRQRTREMIEKIKAVPEKKYFMQKSEMERQAISA